MYRVFHNFCGVPVQTEAPCPMKEDAQAALFRTEQTAPRLLLSLESREELPEPAGQLCASAGEKSTWRDGRTILRQTKDRFRRNPHITVQYDLDDLTVVKALVRQEDWVWATGTKYLWAGVALNQLLLHFRTLFFHASYAAWQGQGILFTAPSQTGKSTQAELWR